MKQWFRSVEQIAPGIIHVCYRSEKKQKNSVLISENFQEQKVEIREFCEKEDRVEFGLNEILIQEVGAVFEEKSVYKSVVDGEPIYEQKESANGTVTVIKNSVKEFEKYMYHMKVSFQTPKEEKLFGLGQHEDGIYDYKGKKEYLYQNNMIISIPFLISTANYGILIDTESSLIFESKEDTISFSIETEEELSYYVFLGNGMEEIIGKLRKLTGRAVMLPRWAFGYIQSKEMYQSADELIDTVQRFREEDIPIDCIVQDWCSWEDEMWGQKTVDKSRYPYLKETISELHKEHVKLMVSIWPNMDAKTQDYQEFLKENLLLPNSNIYNAYQKEGRELYWKQCNRELFPAGVDAWWCDSSEPFTASDWCGSKKRTEEERYQRILEESQQSAAWDQVNSYGLWHAKGISDNWRKENSRKRVVNLSRSTYIGGQRYGVITWSGDISARWDVMKKQIAEGLQMGMSGIPYWTLDIGGFFTVNDKWENRGCKLAGNTDELWFWKGDYNDGTADLGYRELYTRWLQFGTFLPVFRSHGTDTPREPWNFGKAGDMFFDAITKFIRLRYRLLPYIYSCAAAVYRENTTMMRSLLFDFADDKNVWNIADSYMFGRALLVAPVLEPMYYKKNSKKIEPESRGREVYLPQGCDWYDFWSGEKYQGGQTTYCETPIEKIPVFVRAGSIIPVSNTISYADEKNGEISEILVYKGSNGEFTWYQDSGDGYEYEQGKYCAVKIRYFEKAQCLTMEKQEGTLVSQKNFKIRWIDQNGENVTDCEYIGETLNICVPS